MFLRQELQALQEANELLRKENKAFRDSQGALRKSHCHTHTASSARGQDALQKDNTLNPDQYRARSVATGDHTQRSAHLSTKPQPFQKSSNKLGKERNAGLRHLEVALHKHHSHADTPSLTAREVDANVKESTTSPREHTAQREDPTTLVQRHIHPGHTVHMFPLHSAQLTDTDHPKKDRSGFQVLQSYDTVVDGERPTQSEGAATPLNQGKDTSKLDQRGDTLPLEHLSAQAQTTAREDSSHLTGLHVLHQSHNNTVSEEPSVHRQGTLPLDQRGDTLSFVQEQEQPHANPHPHPLTHEQVQAEKDCAHLATTNQRLWRELEGLMASSKRMHSAHSQLQREESRLEAQRWKLTKQHARLQGENHRLNGSLEKLQTANAQLHRDEQELQKANAQLQKENKELQKENWQMSAGRLQLQEQDQELKGEMQELQGRLERFQGADTQLRKEIKELQKENLHMSASRLQLQQDNQALNESVQKLHEANKHLQEENRELHGTIEKLQAESQEMNGTMERLQVENKVLRGSMETLQNAKLQELLAVSSQLQRENQDLQGKTERLQRANAQLSAGRLQLMKENVRLSQEWGRLTERFGGLEGDRDRLQRTVARMGLLPVVEQWCPRKSETEGE